MLCLQVTVDSPLQYLVALASFTLWINSATVVGRSAISKRPPPAGTKQERKKKGKERGEKERNVKVVNDNERSPAVKKPGSCCPLPHRLQEASKLCAISD